MFSADWQRAARRLFDEVQHELLLPEEYGQDLEKYYALVAAQISELSRDKVRSLLVGISGAQGTGKSTLCYFVQSLLEQVSSLRVVTLSLDDFYLDQEQREGLAQRVHPLLRSRGVPGTHEIGRLHDTVRALRCARAGESCTWPKFDKATDQRLSPSCWHRAQGPFDVVLLEGWCVGATPETESALKDPVNLLEKEEDPSGVWRSFVNTALQGSYASLFSELDYRVFLRAPDMPSVVAFRTKQELKLKAARPQGSALLDEPALARFVAHFERLTRHQLKYAPGASDLVLGLDKSHRVSRVELRGSVLSI